MAKHTKHLKNAWNYLVKQYKKGVFKPRNEADIQCFLYHSLIKKGLDASKIHAERPSGKNKKCDIVLGDKKLFIEIKYSRDKDRKEPSKRWEKDIKKLKKYPGNRKSAFVLFIAKQDAKKPMCKKDDNQKSIEVIHKLKRDNNDVSILSYPD